MSSRSQRPQQQAGGQAEQLRTTPPRLECQDSEHSTSGRRSRQRHSAWHSIQPCPPPHPQGGGLQKSPTWGSYRRPASRGLPRATGQTRPSQAHHHAVLQSQRAWHYLPDEEIIRPARGSRRCGQRSDRTQARLSQQCRTSWGEGISGRRWQRRRPLWLWGEGKVRIAVWNHAGPPRARSNSSSIAMSKKSRKCRHCLILSTPS